MIKYRTISPDIVEYTATGYQPVYHFTDTNEYAWRDGIPVLDHIVEIVQSELRSVRIERALKQYE